MSIARIKALYHIIAPELGLTLPGTTIVCGDSHTSTHGAFGTIAFGIGTSEVEHVLATQCLWMDKPKTFAINIVGSPRNPRAVTAKDVILSLIRQIGTSGAYKYGDRIPGRNDIKVFDGRENDYLQYVY